MANQEKFRKIERKISEEIKEQEQASGKVSPEEAARIQSTDLPSGDPRLTPPNQNTGSEDSSKKAS